jgi:hypothetical protein
MKETIDEKCKFLVDNYIYYFFVLSAGVLLNEYARFLSIIILLVLLGIVTYGLYLTNKEGEKC